MMNQFSYINDPSAQSNLISQHISQPVKNLPKIVSYSYHKKLTISNSAIKLKIKENYNAYNEPAMKSKHKSKILETILTTIVMIQNTQYIYLFIGFQMDKLQKQLNYDYHGTDKMVKQEIRKCEERFIEITQAHMGQRKKSDARLMKFIEQKTVLLRDIIERQIKQRSVKGNQIQESLKQDLVQIRTKLQQQKQINSQSLQSIHEQFLIQYQKMHVQFQQIHKKSDQNEEQFYKMLRDIIKKVKQELQTDKIKRQEMEQTILTLIQKLCDKAIEEVAI